MTAIIAELIWLRLLLQDLGVDCSTITKLHCDNRSAIQIAHNDVFHERTKHIEIDCHFIVHSHFSLFPSQDQLVDIFTKPLPLVTFRALASKLKMVSLKPP